MIAYDNQWLYHKYARDQADEAFDTGCIDEYSHQAIYSSSPVGFYTPNIWGRIGIAILTWLAISFSFGLFGLLFRLFDSPAVSMILAGLAMYAALELVVVKQMRHYNSGSDNTLILLVAASLVSGITIGVSGGSESHLAFVSLCATMICGYLAVRFADGLISIAAVLALVSTLFFTFADARMVAPFAIMAVSFALYKMAATAVKENRWLLYRTCLNCVSITALVALYLAGNYYAIDMASGNYEYGSYHGGHSVPLGWLFWLWTLLVPFVYIGIGIRSKSAILIRTGLVLISAAILTYRHYYSLLSVDKALAIGGALLALSGYALSRYLHTPKHGFTFEKENRANERETMHRMVSEHIMGKAADEQKPGNGW